MFIAAELKEGMVIRIEGQIYRVLEAESKAGAAKLGGVVKTKLSNVRSGHIWEPHFRPKSASRRCNSSGEFWNSCSPRGTHAHS